MELGLETLKSTGRRRDADAGPFDDGGLGLDANREEQSYSYSGYASIDDGFDDSGIFIPEDREQQSKSYPGHAPTRPPLNVQSSDVRLFSPTPKIRFEDTWPGLANNDHVSNGTSRAQYTFDNQALYTPPPSNESRHARRSPRRRP